MSNTTLGILIIITFVIQMLFNILLLIHVNDNTLDMFKRLVTLFKKKGSKNNDDTDMG